MFRRIASAASHRYGVRGLIFIHPKVFSDLLSDFSFDPSIIYTVLFNFHTSLNFSAFFFLFLISNFIKLWTGNILRTISVFSDVLKFVFWPNPGECPMWPWEEYLCRGCGWCVQQVSVNWFTVSCTHSVSLLLYLGCSIHSRQRGTEVTNYHCSVVSFPLWCCQFGFMSLWLDCQVYLCLQVRLPVGLTLFIIIKDPSSSPVTFLLVCSVAYFVWFQCRHSSFLLVAACVVHLFPSVRFPLIGIFASEACVPYTGPGYISVFIKSSLTVSAFWLDRLILSHVTLWFIQLDLHLTFHFSFCTCLVPVWFLCFFLRGFAAC